MSDILTDDPKSSSLNVALARVDFITLEERSVNLKLMLVTADLQTCNEHGRSSMKLMNRITITIKSVMR